MFSNNFQATVFLDPGFILYGSTGISVASGFHSRFLLGAGLRRVAVLQEQASVLEVVDEALGHAPFFSH